MITFLGDVALISDHMESRYKPTAPYIFNLEYVISDDIYELTPVKGKINLCSSNSEFDKIFGTNPIAVNVVNNHIYDFGEKGFKETASTVMDKTIPYIADKPLFLNDKVCLCSYMLLNDNSFCQFDFDAAKSTLSFIKKEKPNVRIVVQLHWGIENHPCETDQQRNVAHWLIDNGADLIIGHHPHCLQPAEEYKGKMIFYSLGNALFGNIQLPSHYDENGLFARIYRLKWQKWNRKSIAVTWDEDKNQVVQIDALYQKGDTLFCAKENISKESLMYRHTWVHDVVYKFRKYYLFLVSNMFVDRKVFDVTALKHELRRKYE